MKLCFWISDFAEASRRSSVALEKDRMLKVQTVFKKESSIKGSSLTSDDGTDGNEQYRKGVSLRGCYAVALGKKFPTFPRIVVPSKCR